MKLLIMTLLTAPKTVQVLGKSRQDISLPPFERWGEAVPAEGTHCSNCEYLKDAEKMLCGEPNFIAWEGPSKPSGSNKIPAKDPNSYCSIWWELADSKG